MYLPKSKKTPPKIQMYLPKSKKTPKNTNVFTQI